jgi:hypothetical protein
MNAPQVAFFSSRFIAFDEASVVANLAPDGPKRLPQPATSK